MAQRIKGITVEIGGDTVGLQNALQEVNDTSRDLQKELKDVQKLLKFDPNNTELLAQKQQLLNEQITNSTEKLNALRAAESQIQQQFERGDIGAEQYRAFQRELADTEISLRNAQNALSDMQQEQNDQQRNLQQLNRLFEVTESTVDDYADLLGNRLVRAIQNGTATSRDLGRAFERVASQATGSRDNIQDVRQALLRLDSGEQSIRDVRRQLQDMGQDAQETQSSVKDLGGELTNLAAGAAAGMGIAEVIEKSLANADTNTTIDISFNVPEESKKEIKSSIKSIEAYGVDGEAALEGVRRQWALNSDASDASNKKIVKNAAAISKAYSDVDFTELIQEAHEIALGMGITHDEALGMTNALLKTGFPPDQIDIIAEYGQQLHRAGYSASEIQAIMEAGVETGTWNIDVLLDGLKEGRIILTEFGSGIDDATKEMIAGTSISADKLQEWGKAVAGGGKAGRDAMIEAAKAVEGIDDATKKNELGVKIFGTLWEENGGMISQTLLQANEKTIDLEGNQKILNDTVSKIDSNPTVKMKDALNKMQESLIPVLTKVSEFITMIADWVAKNPELAATIVAIVSVLGILMGIVMALAPIVTAVMGIMTTFGITLGAIATPVLIVVGVIAALIAIGILLYKNWDAIMAKGAELVATIKRKFNEFKEAAGEKMEAARRKIAEVWENVVSFFRDIDLKQIGKDIIDGLINGIGSMATKVWKKAKEIANGIGDSIKEALKIGSPSKLTFALGNFTGEGLADGLSNSMGKIKEMSKQMAIAATPKINSPEINHLENGASGKSLTVNINSPKALDIREANREFNRTLNKMSLMW